VYGHKRVHLSARLHLPGEGATTCPTALSARLTMQKKSLRNMAINSFFCYARRTLSTTGQAVQLTNLGLTVYRLFFLSLLALLLTGCGVEQAEERPRIVPGEPFPELVLPGLDREDLPITQLRGKLVVLNVWATWCPPCRKELPSLQRLGEQLDPQRFAVLALSVDDNKHEPREYLIDRKIKLVSYIDLTMTIVNEALGAQVYPDTYLIGPDGRFLMNIEGDREWDSLEVIAALEAAYAGNPLQLQGILRQGMRE